MSFRDKTRNKERERERGRFVLGYGNKSVFILIKKHCNVMYRVTEWRGDEIKSQIVNATAS